MTQLAEILNVSLSVTAVVLCAAVLSHWFPEARRAVRERRDAAGWLVLGVTVSFLGIMVNTAFWALYLAAEVYHLGSLGHALLDAGPLVNLVTRQVAVVVAAFCHLKAYHMFSREGSRNPAYHFWWSLGAAVLAALTMFITAPGG